MKPPPDHAARLEELRAAVELAQSRYLNEVKVQAEYRRDTSERLRKLDDRLAPLTVAHQQARSELATFCAEAVGDWVVTGRERTRGSDVEWPRAELRFVAGGETAAELRVVYRSDLAVWYGFRECLVWTVTFRAPRTGYSRVLGTAVGDNLEDECARRRADAEVAVAEAGLRLPRRPA